MRRSSPPARATRVTAPALLAHADALCLLEDLALRLDGGRDDELRQLEFADRAGPDRPHAGPQGADQVHRAIVGEGGTEQDLLQWPDDPDADARAARQVRVRRRHSPVVPPPRR